METMVRTSWRMAVDEVWRAAVIPAPATSPESPVGRGERSEPAGLIRTFESSDTRKALLDCDKPDEMWKTLVKLTKETVP
jgi:hypothetical protein